MEILNRRHLLGMTAAALAGQSLASTPAPAPDRKNRRVPMLHVTDLFRPHMDPDDHWDLACVYALAHRGDEITPDRTAMS